jgi:hypothetical protein
MVTVGPVGAGMQELSVLADVVARLEQAQVAYFLTGSVAMGCYVPERTTVDIDIVVQFARTDARRIVGLFEADYYIDRGAVDEAIRLVRSFNIIHFERLIKVDLIVAAPSSLLRQRFARRRRLIVEDVEMWVLAPEDLILAKLEWARTSRSERQFSDVRSLLDGVPDLDREYLNRSANVLGLADLLSETQR